jgi:nicotinate-nucleotide adenylyltransferase
MIIGVLGGTFDPPHMGHLVLARNALASGKIDEVWLVPCLSHRLGKQPAPFEDRLAMCRLLIDGEPSMKVSDIERVLERPGHTFDLVLALRAGHPEAELRLLAGTDIFHEQGQWHLFDEIAKIAPPIYVEREGVEQIPEPTLPAPPGIASSEIREALARGERPQEAIPQKVLDYIEKRGLYGATK